MSTQQLFSTGIILENKAILLKPCSPADFDVLKPIAESSIWEHTSTEIDNEDQLRSYLQTAQQERNENKRLAFTITVKSTGKVIGSTSIGNISWENKRAEIGWTWMGKAFQGKGYNKPLKFLLLQYLFEVTFFTRIEFRTRGTNLQSQRALEKIGATREGVLRNYFIDHGVYYDLIYYSILVSEWPAIKSSVLSSWV